MQGSRCALKAQTSCRSKRRSDPKKVRHNEISVCVTYVGDVLHADEQMTVVKGALVSFARLSLSLRVHRERVELQPYGIHTVEGRIISLH